MSAIENMLNQTYTSIFLWAMGLNLGLLLGSLAFYSIWHRLRGNKIQVNVYQPIVVSDVVAVGSTLICNVIVFVFGAFLWKEGYLSVDFTTKHTGVLVGQLLLLILIIDLLMYFFHKLAHVKPFYALIHQKHHEHIGVNALSLFVLSPLEALGFGLMLMAVLFVYPFHYLSVGLYFVINVLWGTIGHFNRVGKVSSKGWSTWLGTASFHNKHHIEPQKNFGFYTTFWDRLFRTHQTKTDK
ncbi:MULTISPECIES: sterol desaturase family protein [unclassified Myroides]|uniref:sterol desaturase family protein n=1 Tax=unclassified Myroides TaxID=2642485 RepID=UPI003D2F90DD